MNRFKRTAVIAAVLPVAAAAQILVEQADPAHIQNLRGSAGNSWGWMAAFGDFDRDGGVDLLAQVWPDGVLLSRHRADGLFGRWEPVAWPSAAWPADQLVFDFDGDGALDVLVVTGNRRPEIVCGDGRGGFPRARTLPHVLGGHLGVRAGDLDRDGDVDLVWGDNNLAVLRNDGTGGFTLEWQAVSLARWPLVGGTLLRDIDADGDLDLFWGVDLLINDGRGVFRNDSLTRLPPNMTNTPMVAGDFDGNGTVDLIGGLQPQIFLQDGSGVFARRALPTRAAQVWDAVALDVDADGDLDVVVDGIGTGADMTLLLNDGRANFVERTLFDGDDQSYLATVDVDGDGDVDLLGRTLLFLNVGQPTLVAATPPSLTPLTTNRPALAAVGDVDGDGDVDVVTHGDTQLSLYVNDGASNLRVEPGAMPTGPTFGDVDLGDLDRDGDLDLLVGTQIYANDGRGRFASAGSIVALSGQSTVLHDLDGDGDLDAVGGRDWLRNDGAFVFTVVAAPWLGALSDFAIGDFNGDGFVDVFVAVNNLVTGPGQDLMFRGDGRGNFTDVTATSLPQVLTPTVSSRAVDLDRDGDLDLLLGYYQDVLFGNDRYEVRVYQNDGAGRFTDMTLALFGAIPIGDRALARDLDGDGDLDVVVSGQSVRVYEQAAGGFVDRSTAWVAREFGAVLGAADLDEDGDDDLVLTSVFTPTRVVTNHGWQLHAGQLGGTGRRLVLDAHAPAGTVVAGVLAARMLTPKLPTPFGRLGADPASAVSLPGLIAAGSTTPVSWTVAVPNDPALVGLTVVGQAMLVGSADPRTWRLSNVVRLRVVE